MRISRILILGFLLSASCNNNLNPKSGLHRIQVDVIHIGMTIQEMKALYAGAEFIEEPLYQYGIDSENNGIRVTENGESLFFVWTMEDNDTINGIEIISQNIIIDYDVHVGMTLEDFIKKYPDSRPSMDELSMDYEYIMVPGQDYSVQFLTTETTRVADYNYSATEPEFIAIKRPTAEIDRISVFK